MVGHICALNNSADAVMSVKWDVRAQPESGAAAVFTVFPPAMEVRAASSADFSAAFQLSVELRYFEFYVATALTWWRSLRTPRGSMSRRCVPS